MNKTLLILPAALLFVSCGRTLKKSDLYGKWNYLKIEELNHSRDSVPMLQVEIQHPAIIFNKSDELEMLWGGKMLSHGRFKVDGENVQYTETLPDGATRTFPFLVSKLNADTIVFETYATNGSRVTAVRDKASNR